MKDSRKIDEKEIAVRLDPALNKYSNVVLLPEQLAKAKEDVKMSNFLEFLQKIEQEKTQKA
ncbi:MAG: hypothetical protein INR73_25760 [Williamsia sp.]|nr:hypothetical protein [Williamsia sp.]